MLQVNNVSLQFGSRVLFDDVNIKFTPGNCYGIIGANGAGKSTFLKILSGELEPNRGEVVMDKNERMSVLRQNQNAFDDKTVLRTVLLGHKRLVDIMEEKEALYSKDPFTDEDGIRAGELEEEFDALGGWEAEANAEALLNDLKIDPALNDTLMADVDAKIKVKVLLAQALFGNPDILILDEPTNHLDFKTLMWLEDYLNNEFRGAVLIVSHDRYFLDKVATEIWEIEDTEISCYKGNYSKFSVLKKEKIKTLERKWEQEQKKIAELEDYVARNLVRASTTKQAQSRRNELEKMELTQKPKSHTKPPRINFCFDMQTVKDVFHCKGVNLYYGEDDNKTYICKGIELDALKGEKVAIIGENGIGKSSFLRAILKMTPCEYDRLSFGGGSRISYYDQEGKQLHSEKSVINELWDRFPKLSEQEVRSHLGNVLFTGEEVFKKVSSLSGGEKARLAIAIIMLERPNVLVMDEPTNHIDIMTKEALEDALERYEGTLILVSHDRYLLNKIPDKIYELGKDGATLYKGNFEFYLANKPDESKEIQPKKEEKPKSENEVKYYRSKKERALLVSAKKKAEKALKDISENEEKIKELEEAMSSKEVSEDYQKLNEICEKINLLKEENESLSEEWLLLEEEIESLTKE